MAALLGLRALRRLCSVALFLSQLYVLSGRGERGRRRFARAPRGRDRAGRVGEGGQRREQPPGRAAPRAGRALRAPGSAGEARRRLSASAAAGGCSPGRLQPIPGAGAEHARGGSGF